MIYTFKNLPEDVVRIIYAFCVDKRVNWDKVKEQFLKGGFNRKNMGILPFIKEQKKKCLEFWFDKRPELDKFHRMEWNSIKKCFELCPFEYKREWDIKKKSAVVRLITKHGTNVLFSSKNPVSIWLRNINKFEAVMANYWGPSYNKAQYPSNYLPKEKNNFGIKFKSAFYEKQAIIRKKKKEKKAHLEKANRFIEERRTRKKMCGFELNQQVALFFNINESVSKLGSNIKFYMGNVVDVFLKQHRNNGKLIFSKPKGEYEFDNDAVDNYIGETHIKIRFEDGGITLYTPDYLAARIIQSNEMIDNMSNKNFIRGWYTPSYQEKSRSIEKITIKGVQYYFRRNDVDGCWEVRMDGLYRRLDKITIKGVQYYVKKDRLKTNTMVVLEKKRLGVVGEIRESEGEYLLTMV